jgi:hypothetical protein
VRWEFWIIGNEMTESTHRRATQSGRPPGLVHDDHRIRIWAKTWAEVIGDAKHRLKFVETSLQYRSTRERGLAYLRQTHAKYLPTTLQSTDDESQA